MNYESTPPRNRPCDQTDKSALMKLTPPIITFTENHLKYTGTLSYLILQWLAMIANRIQWFYLKKSVTYKEYHYHLSLLLT